LVGDDVLFFFNAPNDGAVAANDGAVAANDGAAGVNDGAAAVNNGAAAVNGGAVVSGDEALAVNDGTGAAKDGALAENDGALAVNDGALAVNDGALAVNDGALAVNDGAEAVNDGVELKRGVDNSDKEGPEFELSDPSTTGVSMIDGVVAFEWEGLFTAPAIEGNGGTKSGTGVLSLSVELLTLKPETFDCEVSEVDLRSPIELFRERPLSGSRGAVSPLVINGSCSGTTMCCDMSD